MGYYINLDSVTLDSFKSKLETAYMIPSRMILKERLDERFNYFKSIGIRTVQDLLQTLKKKDKFAVLSQVSCLSEEYLTILLRELNSIHPKPNKLKDFPGVNPNTAAQLEKAGIKDTLQLFDKVINNRQRKELAAQTGLSDAEILELTKLTDLSRIKWVGAMFATVLCEAGFDTVEKVSKANYEDLYQKITRLNSERNLYKGKIGLNDMKLCVEEAKEVSLEIEY